MTPNTPLLTSLDLFTSGPSDLSKALNYISIFEIPSLTCANAQLANIDIVKRIWTRESQFFFHRVASVMCFEFCSGIYFRILYRSRRSAPRRWWSTRSNDTDAEMRLPDKTHRKQELANVAYVDVKAPSSSPSRPNLLF